MNGTSDTKVWKQKIRLLKLSKNAFNRLLIHNPGSGFLAKIRIQNPARNNVDSAHKHGIATDIDRKTIEFSTNVFWGINTMQHISHNNLSSKSMIQGSLALK